MIKAKLKLDLTPLQGLRKTLVSKILRKATTQSARIVRSAVQSSAEAIKKFGYTAKSIGIRVKTNQTSAVAIVGPRSKWYRESGVRKRGKHIGQPIRFRPSYTAHLIEQGTKRSRIKAFLKPAFDSTQSTFLDDLAHNISDGIAEELSKVST